MDNIVKTNAVCQWESSPEVTNITKFASRKILVEIFVLTYEVDTRNLANKLEK